MQPDIILIAARGQDAHAEATVSLLGGRGEQTWMMDLDGFPSAPRASVEFGDDGVALGVLHGEDGGVDLSRVKSVYLREAALGMFAPRQNPGDLEVFLGLEFEAYFRGLADVLRHARWVNHPEALYAMEPLAAQYRAAREAGFDLLPRSLSSPPADGGVANDAEIVSLIVADGRVIGPAAAPDSVREQCLRLSQQTGLALVRVDLAREGWRFTGCSGTPSWLDLPEAAEVGEAVADLLARSAQGDEKVLHR